MEEPIHQQPSFIDPLAQPGVSPKPAPAKPSQRSGVANELFSFVWEALRVILMALVVIVPIRYFVIQPFFVSGRSMVPNFHDKEYILIEKWDYRLDVPRRGDVVVFHNPNNPKEYYIKRILGLPGETVLAGNDNRVVVYNVRYPDGFTVFEKQYLPDTNPTNCYPSGTSPKFCGTRVTVGPNQYFVMGDNREHSQDSRFFGPIEKSSIAGMAWLRLFPLDKMGFIPRNEYPPVQ